jgi:DNA-binding transcriptional LysR family regulator
VKLLFLSANISRMDTKKLDLNLLQALDALLAERNVTRAAERLHISQPALSAQLARLRVLFGDPLLTPVQRGMQATVLGEELREPLRRALEQLGAVVDSVSNFEPRKAKLTVSIAASDYVQYALLIPFVLHLRERAPGMRIALRRIDSQILAQQMEKGEVDLGILTASSAPQSLRARHLHDVRYVCIVRKGHPSVRKNMTLELFSKLEHIVVSPRGGGFAGATDTALAAHGKRRHVPISASSFLWVPEMVLRSDMVAVVPERLVLHRSDQLKVLESPIPVPGFSVSAVWHERTHAHKGHVWLRQELLAFCADLG